VLLFAVKQTYDCNMAGSSLMAAFAAGVLIRHGGKS
jgi:hypothetical protein